MKFSKRMDRFGTGIFSQLSQMRREQEAAGRRVVDLSVGSPNIPPAPHVRQALIDAAAVGENYLYALSDTRELQQAAAQWYQRRYGVTIDPDHEVVSLLGSQDGLAHISLCVADEGDIVMMPDPCYPIFGDGPLIAGAKQYFMPMRKEKNFLIDFSEIPDDVADRAKLMIVSYPNNPTTALAPASFYEELITFAKKHDILVLHDNAYSELVFDGATCGSFLAYPGAKEVGVEFNSLSKTYGLAGARIGFCLGNREVVEKLSTLKSNMDYGMFLPVQKAAVAAITGDQSSVAQTRQAYQDRRDALCDGLTEIGWNVPRCKSTMFVWAEIPKSFSDSVTFTKALLEKSGVLVTPGSAFGPSGEGHVRMALVQDREEILWAIGSIKDSGILRG